ncbi:hypothetical protein [Picoa juniperi mycovirus 1]|uniref:Uncharacterized protein n=1 Tax=Picoa juniperi mycovirus 1 TaxID=2778518 RepID=A0A7L8Y983_9VIRU|nr:hypothetical protein [Picoa juniperi mycovirus 1]
MATTYYNIDFSQSSCVRSIIFNRTMPVNNIYRSDAYSVGVNSQRRKRALDKYSHSYISGRNAYLSRNFNGAYVSKQVINKRQLSYNTVKNSRANKGSAPLPKGTHYFGMALTDEQLARKEQRRLEKHEAFLIRQARREELTAIRAEKTERFNAILLQQQERYFSFLERRRSGICTQISFDRANYIGWLFCNFPFSYIMTIVHDSELECFYTHHIHEHNVWIPAPASNDIRRVKADNIGLTGVEVNPGPPFSYVRPVAPLFPSPWSQHEESSVLNDIRDRLIALEETCNTNHQRVDTQLINFSERINALELNAKNSVDMNDNIHGIIDGFEQLAGYVDDSLREAADAVKHNKSHIMGIEQQLGLRGPSGLPSPYTSDEDDDNKGEDPPKQSGDEDAPKKSDKGKKPAKTGESETPKKSEPAKPDRTQQVAVIHKEPASCMTVFIEFVLELSFHKVPSLTNALVNRYNAYSYSLPVNRFIDIFLSINVDDFLIALSSLENSHYVMLSFCVKKSDGKTPLANDKRNHVELKARLPSISIPNNEFLYPDSATQISVSSRSCIQMVDYIKDKNSSIYRYSFFSLINPGISEPNDSFAHEGTLRDRGQDQEQVAKITSTAVPELAHSRIVVSEFLYGADSPNVNTVFSPSRIPSTLLLQPINLFEEDNRGLFSLNNFGRSSIASQFCLEYPSDSGRFANSNTYSFSHHRYLFDVETLGVISNQFRPNTHFRDQFNVISRPEAEVPLDYPTMIQPLHEAVKRFFSPLSSTTIDDMKSALSAISHNRYDSLRGYRNILGFESEIQTRYTSIAHFAGNAARGQNYYRLFYYMWTDFLNTILKSPEIIPRGIAQDDGVVFTNDIQRNDSIEITPWDVPVCIMDLEGPLPFTIINHNNPGMRKLSFIHLSARNDSQTLIPGRPAVNLWPERDLFSRDFLGYCSAGIGGVDPLTEYNRFVSRPDLNNPRVPAAQLADELMSGECVFIDASRLNDVQLSIILNAYVQHNRARNRLYGVDDDHLNDPKYREVGHRIFTSYPGLYDESINTRELYPTRFIIHWGERFSISQAISYFSRNFLGYVTPSAVGLTTLTNRIFLNIHPSRQEIMSTIHEYVRQTHSGNDAYQAYDLVSSISNAYLTHDTVVHRTGAPNVPVSAFGVNGLMLPAGRTTGGYFDIFCPDFPNEMMSDLYDIAVLRPVEILNAFSYNVFCLASSINWPSFTLSCTGNLINRILRANVNRFAFQLRNSLFYRRHKALLSPWMHYHRMSCALMYMFAPEERTVLSLCNAIDNYFPLLPFVDSHLPYFFVHPYNNLHMNDILPRHAFLPLHNTLPTWPNDVKVEPLELINPSLRPTVRVAADLDPLSGRAFIQGGGQCANLQYYVAASAGEMRDQFGVSRPLYRGDFNLANQPDSYSLLQIAAWNKPMQKEFSNVINYINPVFMGAQGSEDPLSHFLVPGFINSFDVDANRIRANGITLNEAHGRHQIANAVHISRDWAQMHQYKRQQYVSISYIPPPGFTYEIDPVNDFSLFVMRERQTGAFSGIYMGPSDAADFSHGVEVIPKAHMLAFPSHLANAQPGPAFGKGGRSGFSSGGSNNNINGGNNFRNSNIRNSRPSARLGYIGSATQSVSTPHTKPSASYFSVDRTKPVAPQAPTLNHSAFNSVQPSQRNQLLEAQEFQNHNDEILALQKRLAELKATEPETTVRRAPSPPKRSVHFDNNTPNSDIKLDFSALGKSIHAQSYVNGLANRGMLSDEDYSKYFNYVYNLSPYSDDNPKPEGNDIERPTAPKLRAKETRTIAAPVASFSSHYDNMNRDFPQPTVPKTTITTRATKRVPVNPTPHDGTLQSAVTAAHNDQVQAFEPNKQMSGYGLNNTASYRPTGVTYAGANSLPDNIPATNDAQAAQVQLQGYNIKPISSGIPGFSSTQGNVGTMNVDDDHQLFGHLNFSGR